MPRLVALTEGDLDRLIVKRMLQGLDAKVLPEPGAQSKGKNAALRLVDAEVAAGSSRIILALDLNGSTAEELRAEVKRRLLTKPLRSDPTARDVLLCGPDASPSRICLWPIGLAGDPVLQELGARRHSMEDLLIKALHVPECLANLASREDKVHIPGGSEPWATVKRLATLARKDGYPVDSSKDLLRIFMALIRFGGSLASIGERTVRCAQGTAAEKLFDRPQAFEIP